MKLFKKSAKRNKWQRIIFVTIVALIAIGMVIPLAGLVKSQSDTGGTNAEEAVQKTIAERISALEASAKDNPNDTEILMELAEAYRYAGKPGQAVTTYEQILSLDPNNSEARVELAYTYFYSQKIDQCIAQLQETIRIAPENKDAHYLYAVILAEIKKDYPGGIREMETFIELAKEGTEVEKARQRINNWKAVSAQK